MVVIVTFPHFRGKLFKYRRRIYSCDKEMSRAAVWALIGFGLLFLIASFAGLIFFFPLAIIFLLIGILLGLKPGGVLRSEQVVDSWGALIENAQGKADEVFKDTENFINETKAPSLRMNRKKMAPGFIRGRWVFKGIS